MAHRSASIIVGIDLMNFEILTPQNRLTDCNEALFNQKRAMVMYSSKSRSEPDCRAEEEFGHDGILEGIEQELEDRGNGVGLGASASQTSVAMEDMGYYNE